MKADLANESRACSMCGQMLTPFVHGTTIDSNYNTVNLYMTGHNCPAQRKKYEARLNEISNSSMNAEQQANATMMAGYMNAWGN